MGLVSGVNFENVAIITIFLESYISSSLVGNALAYTILQ